MTIADTVTYIQYAATPAQDTFGIPFEFDADTDLNVYQRAAADDPDDTTDILELTTDYAVVGTDVVLVAPATAGDIVTLVNNAPIARTANLPTSATLTSTDLNNEFDKITNFEKQLDVKAATISPTYNYSATIAAKDLVLPILESNQIWKMNEDNDAIEALQCEDSGCTTLRVELASQDMGDDGAMLVGYYDADAGAGTTLNTKLDNLTMTDHALDGLIDAVAGDVATNTADIATNAGDIATLQGDMTTAQGDIITNAGDIATLQGDMTTAQGDIITNAGDIATNTGDIATNAADILTLQGDLGDYVLTLDLASQVDGTDGATLVGYYDDIAASGTTLDAKLFQLQTDLDTAEGDIADCVVATDLASQVNGSDGATLVGYYDDIAASGTTLDAKLFQLQTDLDTAEGDIADCVVATDLSSQVDGTDGATLVGYYDPETASGTTVNAMLDSVQTQINTLTVGTSNINLIIGGDFGLNPWQRGTSFATVADNAYTADRFKYHKSGAMVHTVSKSADAPTVAEAGIFTQYSVLIDCTTVDASIAAGDYCTYNQLIEGYDFTRIAQRAFTLSFWVKATKTGVYCVTFRNTGSDRSWTSEYTISSADTWEKKVIHVTASPAAGTWSYTNGIGLWVQFVLAAGSTYQTASPDSWETGNYLATSNQVNACDDTANNFRLALIQLEQGSVETGFEIRTHGEELKKCQRYFQKSYNISVVPRTATDVGRVEFWGKIGTSSVFGRSTSNQALKVIMRTTPTITWYSPNTGASGKSYRVGIGDDNVAATFYTSDNQTGVLVPTTGSEVYYGVHYQAVAEL